MRIISGYLKGRIIENKKIEGTRPTMDRVKESLFAMIQNSIKDSVFLDLFSGSGSIGIEAISNGTKEVYFVDNNNLCIKEIKKNIKNFNIEKYSKLLNMDYLKALDYLKNNNIKLDIIFIDPPYKFKVYESILDYINKNELIKENGLIILETDDNKLQPSYSNLLLIKEKKYGDKYIFIYKKGDSDE